MQIDILTIFPKMFDGFLSESIIKRALEKKLVTINIIDFREYSPFNNRQVDDTPYGGGGGMVLRCEPLFRAVKDLKRENSKVILLTPDGIPYNQTLAKDLLINDHIIIICGHYEGFDERIRTLADIEISIGDFILTGGEIPAMAIADSLIRLIPGVINQESLKSESFDDKFLDYPTYTKPSEFEGLKVPEILLSGDHEKIKQWRIDEQIKKTNKRRPDLLK